jgi:hypothetical protein
MPLPASRSDNVLCLVCTSRGIEYWICFFLLFFFFGLRGNSDSQRRGDTEKLKCINEMVFVCEELEEARCCWSAALFFTQLNIQALHEGVSKFQVRDSFMHTQIPSSLLSVESCSCRIPKSLPLFQKPLHLLFLNSRNPTKNHVIFRENLSQPLKGRTQCSVLALLNDCPSIRVANH